MTAIVQYAEEINADMAVIGYAASQAMSMVTSTALGSVAEWVLQGRQSVSDREDRSPANMG